MASDDLLRLIEPIYEAALDPTRWREVLAGLCARYHGSAVLFIQDETTDAAGFLEFVGTDPRFVRSYAEHYAAINPVKGLWIDAAEGTLIDSSRVLDHAAFQRSEFYNDFFRPQDVYHALGAILIKDGPIATNVSLQRAQRAGLYTEQELAEFRILMPHIRRSIEISRRLTAAQWEREAASSPVNGASRGCIFVDADNRFLLADKLAEEILHADDGLGVSNGRLCGATADATLRLATMVRDAARTAMGMGTQPGGVLVMPRRRLVGHPLALLVCPWRGNPLAFGVPGPAVLIFVEDPNRTPRPSAAGAAELYRLTAAETRLLEALIDGQRLAEYAAAADVGMPTAKSHLQSLFAKTGQRRQADLLRVVLSSALAQGRGERSN